MSSPSLEIERVADRDDAAVARAVAETKAHAQEFARLAPATKAALLRECIVRLLTEAPAWAAEGARRRGAPVAEEWLAGPAATVRLFRLLAESLEAIATRGKPPLGRGVRLRDDGRMEVVLFPTSTIDRLGFPGFTAHALMQPGITPAIARARQAAFYGTPDPRGGVSVILGAGNVSSIPPLDVASKMFVEGFVCILKMNPVNEWVGPYVERALEPLIRSGWLRVVYGGAEVGQQLVYHPDVDDVHITGSDRTHDAIVWGPPGPERERRLAENDPLLKIPISSELGNVSPVVIVPGPYSAAELEFVADNVASMVFNNGSFNCNAAKMVVTAKGWSQRDAFLRVLEDRLGRMPTRLAYYPGAFDRYRALVEPHPEAQRFGEPRDGELPWTFIPGLDPQRDDPLFRTEPFCGILSETSVGSTDPVGFLDEMTTFLDERLWGTLNAMIVIHPRVERDAAVARALDTAIVRLRYGTVAINHWPALGYAFGTPPWGGHPSATLRDVQSGIGWVHNSFMLDGIDKSVVRGPLTTSPRPLYFWNNARAAAVAPLIAELEALPGWLKLPGLLLRAIV